PRVVPPTWSKYRLRFDVLFPLAASATPHISLADAALAGGALHMARRSGRGCRSIFPYPFRPLGRNRHPDRGLRPQSPIVARFQRGSVIHVLDPQQARNKKAKVASASADWERARDASDLVRVERVPPRGATSSNALSPEINDGVSAPSNSVM